MVLVGLSLAVTAVPLVGCSTGTTDGVGAAAADRRIAHVVFIDHEIICPSVKKVSNATWIELQKVVASRDIKVTRIHKDRQANLARKYTTLKPTGAVPAIYFLARDGALVELLGGEQTAEQIAAVLDRGVSVEEGKASGRD